MDLTEMLAMIQRLVALMERVVHNTNEMNETIQLTRLAVIVVVGLFVGWLIAKFALPQGRKVK